MGGGSISYQYKGIISFFGSVEVCFVAEGFKYTTRKELRSRAWVPGAPKYPNNSLYTRDLEVSNYHYRYLEVR